MKHDILILGALAAGVLFTAGKIIGPSGFQQVDKPQQQQQGTLTPSPDLLDLGHKADILAARESVAIVPTGTTFNSAEVWQDRSAGGALILRSGIVDLGPVATSHVMSCGEFKDTGLIWDFSTGACHDVPWYRANQPGLAWLQGL